MASIQQILLKETHVNKKIAMIIGLFVAILIAVTIWHTMTSKYRSYETMLGEANNSKQLLISYEQSDSIRALYKYVSRHDKADVQSLISNRPIYHNHCENGTDYCAPAWIEIDKFKSFHHLAIDSVKSKKDKEYMSYYTAIKDDPLAKCSIHYYNEEPEPPYSEQLCVSPKTGLSIYLSFIS